LLDFALGREAPQGFIYDFQVLLGGLLAFGAGLFVWLSTKESIKNDKIKELDKYRIRKASLATAILAEFTNIKVQEELLGIRDVLTKQQKDILDSHGRGEKEFEFNGIYFFFKDEILPVYNSNTNKIGLLDPNVAEVVVITASLITTAVRQIELVGEKNINRSVTNIDDANYALILALKATSQAINSIDTCNKKLEELICKNHRRLSSINEYF